MQLLASSWVQGVHSLESPQGLLLLTRSAARTELFEGVGYSTRGTSDPEVSAASRRQKPQRLFRSQ